MPKDSHHHSKKSKGQTEYRDDVSSRDRRHYKDNDSMADAKAEYRRSYKDEYASDHQEKDQKYNKHAADYYVEDRSSGKKRKHSKEHPNNREDNETKYHRIRNDSDDYYVQDSRSLESTEYRVIAKKAKHSKSKRAKDETNKNGLTQRSAGIKALVDYGDGSSETDTSVDHLTPVLDMTMRDKNSKRSKHWHESPPQKVTVLSQLSQSPTSRMQRSGYESPVHSDKTAEGTLRARSPSELSLSSSRAHQRKVGLSKSPPPRVLSMVSSIVRDIGKQKQETSNKGNRSLRKQRLSHDDDVTSSTSSNAKKHGQHHDESDSSPVSKILIAGKVIVKRPDENNEEDLSKMSSSKQKHDEESPLASNKHKKTCEKAKGRQRNEDISLDKVMLKHQSDDDSVILDKSLTKPKHKHVDGERPVKPLKSKKLKQQSPSLEKRDRLKQRHEDEDNNLLCKVKTSTSNDKTKVKQMPELHSYDVILSEIKSKSNRLNDMLPVMNNMKLGTTNRKIQSRDDTPPPVLTKMTSSLKSKSKSSPSPPKKVKHVDGKLRSDKSFSPDEFVPKEKSRKSKNSETVEQERSSSIVKVNWKEKARKPKLSESQSPKPCPKSKSGKSSKTVANDTGAHKQRSIDSSSSNSEDDTVDSDRSPSRPSKSHRHRESVKADKASHHSKKEEQSCKLKHMRHTSSEPNHATSLKGNHTKLLATDVVKTTKEEKSKKHKSDTSVIATVSSRSDVKASTVQSRSPYGKYCRRDAASSERLTGQPKSYQTSSRSPSRRRSVHRSISPKSYSRTHTDVLDK